jgi:hypothetical protein
LLSAQEMGEPLLARLAPALTSPEAVERVRRRARDLPALLTGGVECRLGGDRAAPDLGLVASSREGAPALLEAWPDPGLSAFARAFEDDDVRSIALEFDGPDYALAGWFVTFRDRAGPAPVRRAFEAARRVGAGRSPVEAERLAAAQGAVLEVADRLPAGVLLQTMGFMVGRAPSAVRLNLGGTAGDLISRTLDALAWPGDGAALEATLAVLRPFLAFAVVCVDVGEHIGPRLGIECFFKNLGPIAERLAEQHLCTDQEAASLQAIEGTGPSPGPLTWLGATVRVRVNHVKLDLTPGGLRAKAYLIWTSAWGNRERH